jgi:hypothetical protein
MKYCKTCKVHYNTPLDHCMLCNGDLDDDKKNETIYKFQDYVKKGVSSKFFFRLFYYINIVSIIVTLYIDYQQGLPLSWSLVVGITNIYAIVMFAILTNPTLWTSKLTKSIVLTVLSVILIGLSIRDYDWAIDYVFPLAVLTNTFLISILIITNKKKWFDYFVSLIFISIVGLIPGLFNLIKITNVQWPSLICFSYSAFTILGIILLPSKSSRDEFKRRFHI